MSGSRREALGSIRMDYRRKICYTRFVGTHAEYDKINANTI